MKSSFISFGSFLLIFLFLSQEAFAEETKFQQFLRDEYQFAEFSSHAKKEGQSSVSPLIKEEEKLSTDLQKEGLAEKRAWFLALAFYEDPFSECTKIMRDFIKFKQMQSLNLGDDEEGGKYREREHIKSLSLCR